MAHTAGSQSLAMPELPMQNQPLRSRGRRG
jgi:hypothetical protein